MVDLALFIASILEGISDPEPKHCFQSVIWMPYYVWHLCSLNILWKENLLSGVLN